MRLGAGPPISQPSTSVLVMFTLSGVLFVGIAIWGAVSTLLLRRRAFSATATIIDVNRRHETDDATGFRLPHAPWTGWIPEVELIGPDGQLRRVNVDSVVLFRPVIGGTARVLCEPDNPSRVYLRSFFVFDNLPLFLSFIIGSVLGITGAVDLLHHIAG